MGLNLWSIVGIALVYFILKSIYRLYFHPLSKFPGPKLTAVTHLYEFYYDGIKGGRFIWKIQEMHEKYGPIVRINPRELHIRDPYYYNQLYTGKKLQKDPYIVNVVTSPRSSFSTLDHDHHRFRRGIVDSFFSKKAVMGMENIVQGKVEQACECLDTANKSGASISVDSIFAAVTADTVSHYTYGESMGVLDSDDLRNDFRDAVNGNGKLAHFTRFFPFMVTALDLWPDFFEWLQPSAKGLFNTKRMLIAKAKEALANEQPEKKADGSPKTIFDSLCDKSLPPEEITPMRVRDEALVVLGAGTETTVKVLSVGAFHLYRDPTVLMKLREELKGVMPQPLSRPSWVQLEKLPYLTAVINESLRLAHSVTIRLPRISPNTSMVYQDYTIPPGTPVSESIYFTHTDPRVFPDPDKFNPDRWIEASQKGERLDRFLVAFQKGSRMCLGMNLAYCEIYLMFAALFRRFDLDFSETTPESIQMTRDLMIGMPESGEFIVRARVAGILDA